MSDMYSTDDIYLDRLFSAYKLDNPPCPHCKSERTFKEVDPSKKGMPTKPRTYLCSKCGKRFVVNPLADDDSIPF